MRFSQQREASARALKRRVRPEKDHGYLFAVTFLLFALFDLLNSSGFSADTLAILNVIAILAALAGMYLVVKEK